MVVRFSRVHILGVSRILHLQGTLVEKSEMRWEQQALPQEKRGGGGVAQKNQLGEDPKCAYLELRAWVKH